MPRAAPATPPSLDSPPAEEGLALIKPSVRAARGYTLEAIPAARKLNQNESPLDVPAPLKRMILERAERIGWNRYPDFVPHRLAEIIAARHDWDPAGVLVGNGSNEMIQATLAVTVGPGDTVVAPDPTFALYRLLSSVMGARYVAVPLGPEFAYNPETILAVAQKENAKVIVLNAPNNPTGSALPEGAVQRFLAETGALVLCDEAYQDFGGTSAIPLLRTSSRLVVLRTFSKSMGMAGLRFGYALTHPAVQREIAKAKLPYNVNALTLAAAEVAAEHPEVFAERTRATIRERDRMSQALERIPGIHVFPSATNFVLLRSETLPVAQVFQRLLDEYGILVRDVAGSPALAQCLRVSVGTPEDTDALIAALRDIFQG
jgi:histidinol-phosphate aminotransferase